MPLQFIKSTLIIDWYDVSDEEGLIGYINRDATIKLWEYRPNEDYYYSASDLREIAQFMEDNCRP